MVRTEMLVVGGRHLQWLEAGDVASERVLVWLHAFPLSSGMWEPQLTAVPTGWRVLAPDLAGQGASDDHAGPPSIDDYASDLEALMDAIGISSAVIGGVSMGGYATLACHRHMPSRARGYVLADTKAGPDTPAAREGREKMLQIIDAHGVDGVADEMLPKMLGPTTRHSRPNVESRVRVLVETNSAEGLRRAVHRLRDRPDAVPQLASMAVPTLVMVGEEDAVTPLTEARLMAETIPSATLTVIPAAGHVSNLENPAAFNAALNTWLPQF
jgi:pimeloyl-ACP methyl ester carboxylesterase